MSKRAPINDLQEIARRKQEIKAKIEVQERKLSKDPDEYQDDVETFKKFWSGVKGVRHIGQNFSSSSIGQAIQTVRALPIGKKVTKTSGKPGWLAAISIGAEVANWIIHRRRKRKKSNN